MDRHEPDPEFVEGLEWQLRREMRRQRFASEPTPGSSRWTSRRLWRTAAVVVLSLLAGFATATAAQEIGERRQREYLTLRLETALARADLQVEFGHRRLEAIRQRVEAGTLRRAELERMRAEVEQMERQRRSLRLDLEEVAITGREPRSDLAAPLVNGRDFVAERLELEMRGLEAYRDAMQERQQEVLAQALPRALADDVPRIEAEMALIGERREMLEQRRRLRRRFVDGEIGERQVVAREARLEARVRLRSSRARASLLEERTERLRTLVDAGELGEQELLLAEYELAMAELDLREAQLELEHAQELGGR